MKKRVFLILLFSLFFKLYNYAEIVTNFNFENYFYEFKKSKNNSYTDTSYSDINTSLLRYYAIYSHKFFDIDLSAKNFLQDKRLKKFDFNKNYYHASISLKDNLIKNFSFNYTFESKNNINSSSEKINNNIFATKYALDYKKFNMLLNNEYIATDYDDFVDYNTNINMQLTYNLLNNEENFLKNINLILNNYYYSDLNSSKYNFDYYYSECGLEFLFKNYATRIQPQFLLGYNKFNNKNLKNEFYFKHNLLLSYNINQNIFFDFENNGVNTNSQVNEKFILKANYILSEALFNYNIINFYSSINLKNDIVISRIGLGINYSFNKLENSLKTEFKSSKISELYSINLETKYNFNFKNNIFINYYLEKYNKDFSKIKTRNKVTLGIQFSAM